MSGSNVQSQQDSPDSGHDVPAGQHGPHLAWQGLIYVPSVNPLRMGHNGNGWKVHMFLSSRSVPVEKTPCRPVWCYVLAFPSEVGRLVLVIAHEEICMDLNDSQSVHHLPYHRQKFARLSQGSCPSFICWVSAACLSLSAWQAEFPDGLATYVKAFGSVEPVWPIALVAPWVTIVCQHHISPKWGRTCWTFRSTNLGDLDIPGQRPCRLHLDIQIKGYFFGNLSF